jgi:hypothetical protein
MGLLTQKAIFVDKRSNIKHNFGNKQMPSKNISKNFKKTFLAMGIILAFSITDTTFADNLSSDQLLELDQFLQDIDKGKVTSLPSAPASTAETKASNPSTPSEKSPVSAVAEPEDDNLPNNKMEAGALPSDKKEDKAEEEKTDEKINNIISNTEKKESKKDASADKDAMMQVLINQEHDSADVNKVEPNIVKNDIHENDVKKYLETKEEFKNKVETSTKFSDTDLQEDIDYVKEKAKIIDDERKAREDELARLAAIKYIVKSESIPVNNYMFSLTFNSNRFFKEPTDKSIANFKQYVLTKKQKDEIAPESLPKNDYIKGYKNITDNEVTVIGEAPKLYEMGVKYIIQILDFDIENNRIRIKVDANNNLQIAEVISTKNKEDTLEEKHYKVLQNRSASETFWISNNKKASKVISLGDGQELVVRIDNITKTNEMLEYKVIDLTEGKSKDSTPPVEVKTPEQIKAEEAQKAKEKEAADKAEKEKQEKEKGFFGKFF